MENMDGVNWGELSSAGMELMEVPVRLALAVVKKSLLLPCVAAFTLLFTFVFSGALLAVAITVLTIPAAAATVDAAVVQRFEDLSLPAPTLSSVVVCHGFGCRFRTQIGLSAADHAKLTQLLATGRASAEAERKAVAEAVAWFERRVAPEAGTAAAKAYATGPLEAQPSQFDCIDASTNTTTTLMLLEELGLLRFHRLKAPVSRSPFLGLGVIHTTAVLVELQGRREWAIDSWVRNNGQPPDVLPLKTWYAGN
jgi:hypothetical protein